MGCFFALGILILMVPLLCIHIKSGKSFTLAAVLSAILVGLIPLSFCFPEQRAETKTVVNTTSASVKGERSNIVDSGMTVTIDGVEYYLYQRGN